jgi:hypothetical protein
MLGFAFALAFATIWTGIVYVIDEAGHGKAYGAVVGIYNMFMTVVPLIVRFLKR